MDHYTLFILILAVLGWTIAGVSSFEGLWVVADTTGWKAFIAIISGPAAWGVLLWRAIRKTWVDHLVDSDSMKTLGYWLGFY